LLQDEWYWQCRPVSARKAAASRKPARSAKTTTSKTTRGFDLSGLVNTVKDKVSEAVNTVKNTAADAANKVKDTANKVTNKQTPAPAPRSSKRSTKRSRSSASTLSVPNYQQCGGTGGLCKDGTDKPCTNATWPAAKCADPTFTCTAINQYHWQCSPADFVIVLEEVDIIADHHQCGGKGGDCKAFGACEDSPFPTAICHEHSICAQEVSKRAPLLRAPAAESSACCGVWHTTPCLRAHACLHACVPGPGPAWASVVQCPFPRQHQHQRQPG
jgi:hypothetical protein